MELPIGTSSSPNHFATSSSSSSSSSSTLHMPVDNIVHVAVGKSIEKSVDLLKWTFRHFENRDIGLVHVHQPSTTIPTLLGKLPATQANEEMVKGYRREEEEQCQKLLLNYLNICSKAKVKATIFTAESEQVHKGIVELVRKHRIRKLVIGAASDNVDFYMTLLQCCLKVKKGINKANYARKYAPPFCEIWFINKGNHAWTREASENLTVFITTLSPAEQARKGLRSRSSPNDRSDYVLYHTFPRYNSCPPSGAQNLVECPGELELALSADGSSFTERVSKTASSSNSLTSASVYASAGIEMLPEISSVLEGESFYNQMLNSWAEAETTKKEAFSELLKRRRLEYEAVEAINKVKAIEVARAYEVQLRKEVEKKLRTTRRELEKILEEREDASRELQRTMQNVAVLDSLVKEVNCRQNESARELKLIKMSLTAVRHEKKSIHRQKEEALQHLEWWRSRGQVRASSCSLVNSLGEYKQFSLCDLEIATITFDISVVSLKVEVLCKLKHPHLATLIGACPEEWSVVYEYLPNGNLQDHLFRKTRAPLTWKTRIRIVANMSSALLYLHSSKPEKIIHGNLKLENILLDSDLNCKIGDYGIYRLVPKNTARCPSFRGISETKNALPYTDPELQTPGDLTSKSDIYSFGVIILQLLTGRSPVGLASEVRRAVSCGNVESILDPSAGEWPTFVARRVVELGLKCCESKSRDRPELKPSFVRELEKLHLTEEKPVPSFFLCPILKEIMHDPQLASDGFTYEGEALRGWLNNGRETSPMTNLKLSDLHLTPNHALRLAIRDWLCQ
ncbi:hypothetical protein IFM89_036613 [Coptis chinensis]|uniref:RING-type E3 ubiquitin transferase n=1 Tax=Coptis chinensis TaxID=261450 RepID=A0A835HEZ7_9MAGN|nr:hypothetical protein IFM89_036613 [Coptis chinensis]